MSRQLITLRDTDRVSQAVREMGIASIRHMLVVDRHERLVGIASTDDLVHALSRRGDVQLHEVMTTDIVTVTPDTPANEAIGKLIDFKIHALPVVTKERELCGIITATDFLAVAHQALIGEDLARIPGEL